MKSITPIISVILLVMITLVAAGSAFFFINSNVADLQSSGSIESYPGMDDSRINLVSVTGSKAILRNDGSSPVTDLVVLINGELLNYTLAEPILPGELKEITYNARQTGEDLEVKVFYGSGQTVEKTSPAIVNTPVSGFTPAPLPLNRNPVEDFKSYEEGQVLNDTNGWTNLGNQDESCNATIQIVNSSKVLSIYDQNDSGGMAHMSYELPAPSPGNGTNSILININYGNEGTGGRTFGVHFYDANDSLIQVIYLTNGGCGIFYYNSSIYFYQFYTNASGGLNFSQKVAWDREVTHEGNNAWKFTFDEDAKTTRVFINNFEVYGYIEGTENGKNTYFNNTAGAISRIELMTAALSLEQGASGNETNQEVHIGYVAVDWI